MKGLNKVTLIGNLGADPEMRFTPAGKPVTTFSVATGRKYYDQENNLKDEVTWHRVVTWDKLAETCNKLDKGALAYIEGRIANRSWEDDAGVKHYSSEIVANNVIFLSGKKDERPVEDIPGYDEGGPVPQKSAEPQSLVEAAVASGAVPETPAEEQGNIPF